MNILKPLENFYQAIIKNPRTALATLGIGAGLTGALFPKTSASIIDYLDMSPTKSLETKDLYGKSTTYGQRNFLGTAATGNVLTKNRSFLGMDSGLLYDIRRGIGKTLSTPFKLGEMFNSNGSLYKYILGKEGGTLANVGSEFRAALPFSTGEGSNLKKILEAYRASGSGGGGGGGGGSGSGGAGFSRGRRTATSYSPGTFKAQQVKGYNPYGMSANLLARAYQDNTLGWINRQSQRQNRIGPNIGIKEANISVKQRFTRTR